MSKYRVPVLETFSWQEPVLDRDLKQAPAATKGHRYLIPSSGIQPGDVWEGHENDIAWFNGTVWKFDSPENGWYVYVQDEKNSYRWNGVEWGFSEGAAVASVGLFVDKNRVDEYPENGSIAFPYKTIQAAIDSVAAEGDNTAQKGYVISVSGGEYEEDLKLDSTSLVNIMIKGSGHQTTFLKASASIDSLRCNSNNDNLTTLILAGMTFRDNVVLEGASNGTNFGSSALELKECQFDNCDLMLKNANSPILDDVGVSGNVLWSNVSNGLVSGNQTFGTFTVECDDLANKPAGWLGSTYGTVVQNAGHRIDDFQFNLVNGGKSYISLRSGAYIDSSTSVIPADATVVMYNSTLKDDWTLNGKLSLSAGSFVTGILTEETGSTLEIIGQKASQISVGDCDDGNMLADGIVPIAREEKVANVLDTYNEILKDLAPPEADPLSGVLYGNRTMYTGKLSVNADANWAATGYNPGDTVDIIVNQNNIVMASGQGDPDTFDAPGNVPRVASTTNSANFRQGDRGLLKAIHKDASAEVTAATLDIEANYYENAPGSSPPRPHVQDLTQWDNQGEGDPVTDAVVAFVTGGTGNLQVTDVRWFNDFNLWQKMNAQINVSGLSEGYHAYKLSHEFAVTEQSDFFELFYDNDTTNLAFDVNPTIVEDTINSSVYVSGVRYYGVGDTFTVNFVGAHVFKKVYHKDQVARFVFGALNGNQNRNPVGVPNWDDTFTVNEVISLDRANIYQTNGRMTAYLYHPWKSGINAQSPSEQRHVNTYSPTRSTDKMEYFTDEQYRLPDGAYDSVPASLTGNWNSQDLLVNGQALVYNQSVQYPAHNLTTILPAGNPDYSAFTGNQVYLRAFYTATAKNAVALTIPGISRSDIGAYGSGNINLQVKLPGESGWLDAGKAFMAATFTGVDGDGCLVSQSGAVWNITFGTKTTANSNGVVIVRFTFNNSNAIIGTGMGVNW